MRALHRVLDLAQFYLKCNFPLGSVCLNITTNMTFKRNKHIQFDTSMVTYRTK
jgi:hypothetical protein